jgi:hypothetical protein
VATGTVLQIADERPSFRDRPGWIGRTVRALAFALSDVDTVIVALAGFLLRGGIVLLLAPSIVLPSVIGVAGITGVDAIGIDGRPTMWLVLLVTLIAVVAAVWLLLAFIVGSLVDVWLIESARDRDAGAGTPRPLPELRVLLDLAAIRSVCLVPLAAVSTWAITRIYSVAYTELTTPTNLASPLLLRVIQGAADAVFVVAATWLAAEVVGAIAVRRFLLRGDGVLSSLAGAFEQLGRRPLTSIGTIAVSYGASFVATVLAMAATAITFDWCRVASRNGSAIRISFGPAGGDARPIVFILAAIALGLAWVVALGLSGIASAWRSAAFTGETAATVLEARTGPVE